MLRLIALALLGVPALAACGSASRPESERAASRVGVPTPSSDTQAASNGASGTAALSPVDAAKAFIAALSETQRAAALYPIDADVRPNWSNLPAGITRFERNGVRIGDLDEAQFGLMQDFLRAALSADGYDTVVGVVGADGVLSAEPRAARLQWSEDNYWLAFFGEPSDSQAWAWQFGGHHLAVNITVAADGRAHLSPTLVGVEPASYDVNGTPVAPMQTRLDAGLAVIRALDADAQAAAMVDNRPDELYAGADADGVVPPLEGARVAAWDAELRSNLLNAIALYVGMMDAASAQRRLAEIEAELDDAYFAWHGASDGDGAMYYRIQSPSLIIEFSTQGRVGADGGHYHSIYRDPTNDYGAAALGR